MRELVNFLYRYVYMCKIFCFVLFLCLFLTVIFDTLHMQCIILFHLIAEQKRKKIKNKKYKKIWVKENRTYYSAVTLAS